MSLKPIIELCGVVSAHPNRRLAQSVDFTLYAGEHIAILGDNGIGKSVFVDLLVGLCLSKVAR